MMKIIKLLILSLLVVSCSNTRWTVVDFEAVDYREDPLVTDVSFSLVTEQIPTHQDPYITFTVKQVNEVELPQRVLMERTIQRYKPKPFFTVLSTLGAGAAFYAANSNTIINNLSTAQSLAFNSAGLLLTTLAFTHLEPVGDPIETGEQTYLRRSGTVAGTDTVAVTDGREFTIDLTVTHNGNEIYVLNAQPLQEDSYSLNVASLMQNRNLTGSNPGDVTVTVSFLGNEKTQLFPVSSFMTPVIHIDSPVAQLRSEPVFNTGSLFSEVASGSELMYLGEEGTQWYEVQFGGTSVFVAREDGEVHWNPVQNGDSPTVYTVPEVPFGDLSVENSIPVLRRNNPGDAGFIISNHVGNQAGQRSYLDRDLQMMDLYFRNAFNISADRVENIQLTGTDGALESINSVPTDSLSTIFVYIAGFATVSEGEEGAVAIEMIHIDEENKLTEIPIVDLLEQVAQKSQQQMIIFADIEFQHIYSELNASPNRNNGTSALLNFANSILSIQPNTAIIFSSRVDQSTGVYVNERYENRHHHIFPYYLAQALQQRRTGVNALIRYLENQVDYTSRLLFDRPQEVQSFGNFTIDISY